ncbi:DUF4123 domain-containing protein [Trinickia dinghuensis]|uniref:DUF4123 domain-containing protein n=1 Tax=Trinickia dinghuensis TaxID=2291023 RepID=A0A3D8K5M0_9BURK|nr:DUF4123 domain-containing protein [Trinickia dinghuensis]RDV00734.1 DUF4123 domain-containing protein [Trinickia dinghuensis]
MQHDPDLFSLIDGAASPARLAPLLEQSGAQFVSLYKALPEAQLGPASLFLARIDDPDATWLGELNEIDLHSPCLTLFWSRVSLQELAIHLSAFLFAGIGEGMTVMIRFFDPRNTGAVLEMWSEQIRDMFLSPIVRLKYRGRHEQWQTVESDPPNAGCIFRSVAIDLDQQDIDKLTAHSEPDVLMASLVDFGHIDQTLPYRRRFLDFEPRYIRALDWGFVEPRDRLTYCDYSYRFGANFDQHRQVRDALTSRRETSASFDATMDRIPRSVWNDLKRRNEALLRAYP